MTSIVIVIIAAAISFTGYSTSNWLFWLGLGQQYHEWWITIFTLLLLLLLVLSFLQITSFSRVTCGQIWGLIYKTS